jgi:SAM-dependent methyltransferase
MKTDMKQYYRKSDHFGRYQMTNKDRVKRIKKIYLSNKKYFGKKVLDIACGGGVLGFVIESKGHAYTGIDINPDMISSAKKYAKEIRSQNKFLLGDATKKKINGKFDTITMLGNALCHINTHDFLIMLKNVSANTHKGTYFIIDYRDIVDLLFKKQWKDRWIEKKVGKIIVSLTTGADTEFGEIYKKAFEKNGKNKINFSHTIWSPFIIEPIMKSFGWKLLKRKRIKEWQGWIDIYKKVD